MTGNNTRWTASYIPEQAGRLFIITGANSGIGFEAARTLAAHRATVIMAVRSPERGEQAAADIRRETPDADLHVMPLDLSDLASVKVFADDFRTRFGHLDVLINNAGVMALPQRQTTADGFEKQFGTNHLGHFALTGHLIDLLVNQPNARIVTVSSNAHRFGRINFDDLQSKRSYNPWRAYSQSKLANLLFAFELQRRLTAAGSKTISVGCHPGWAATNLQYGSRDVQQQPLRRGVMKLMNSLLAQSAAMGALPTLYAAVAPDVNGCDYIGPSGLMHSRGYPAKEQATDAACDETAAALLWGISERLTGVRYDALQTAEHTQTAPA
ncbi:MAG: oxidoreductase [Anaerolineae bacterium]